MPFFKKNQKQPKEFTAKTKIRKKGNKPEFLKEKKIKKKTKIGFRHKEKKTPEKTLVQPEKQTIPDKTTEKEEQNKKPDEDFLTEDIPSPEEKTIPPQEKKEELPKTKKKKAFIKKDMRDKPVYLEDTGEKLGTVFDMIYDKENNLIGYKIKDRKSDAVLSFSIDQFDEDKDGLIFVPSWYTKAVKTIEKFEFKDRVSPELTNLLTDDAVSNKELYNIFVKHDDEMAKHIEDAFSLKEILNNRLRVLEKQRLSLKDSLMDLTEKRLIKDIDRREFSEDVTHHRRKANILDVNIKKCKELLSRLDHTSFGILGKNQEFSDIKIENNYIETTTEDFKNSPFHEDKIETMYKNKYLTLKEQYKELEDEYKELKTAVERLLQKNEI